MDEDVSERCPSAHDLDARLESEARDPLRPVLGAPVVKPLAPLAAEARPEGFRVPDSIETAPAARVGFANDDRPSAFDRMSHSLEQALLLLRLHVVKRVKDDDGSTLGELHVSEIGGVDLGFIGKCFLCDRYLLFTNVETAQLDVSRRWLPTFWEIAFLVKSLGRADGGQCECLSASEIDDPTR